MYILYNLLLFILLLLYLPVFIYKLIKGNYRKNIQQRFGFITREIIEIFKNQKTIWIHAVSVGETVAASSIVREIKRDYPDCRLLFSTVTDTGQEMARKMVKEADAYIYFPLDFSFVVKKVLKLINPELVIIMETELWPNFIRTAGEMDIKVMLANGRISDDSAGKYKFLGPLLNKMLANIDIFSMQSVQDKEYILDLGANSKKVYNTGNTKFDRDFGVNETGDIQQIYEEFKINPDQPVLVAGSTHPDEEKQLIPVYRKLKEEFEDLLMILAPRHVKRAAEISDLYRNNNINIILRTEIEDRDPETNSVILLNTIGELAGIYSIADLVFVGGSLMEKGGHNILEPAAHGKAVFFGPHMFNFKESRELVLRHGVGIQVKNRDELMNKMLYYLNNRDELQRKGEKAREMIEANKGASRRNADLVNRLLGVN